MEAVATDLFVAAARTPRSLAIVNPRGNGRRDERLNSRNNGTAGSESGPCAADFLLQMCADHAA